MRIKAGLLAVLLAALLVAGEKPASAGTASASATITVNYAAACTVSVGSLEVGVTDRTQSTPGEIGVTVNCSNTIPWSFVVDYGLYPSSPFRRAKHTTSNFYGQYRLYKDAARTQYLTDTTTVTGTGTGSNQSVSIHFLYANGDLPTNAPAGTYSDTITLTLTY